MAAIWMKFLIQIEISLRFVSNSPINIIPALVQNMASLRCVTDLH